jgi:hypothetical protein
MGQVSVRWARGFSREAEDGMAKIKAHNRSDEVQAKIKNGELVPESELGISRNPDNLDGPLASSDSQTAIMAQYENSQSSYDAEQARIDSLLGEEPQP